MSSKNVMVRLEYPPPFDGNGEEVILGPFFWVEQEGNDIRADDDDSGEGKTIAWRSEIDDIGPLTFPGKKVAVWNTEKGGVFGRLVIYSKPLDVFWSK